MDSRTKITSSPFSKYGHDCTLEDLPEEYEYKGIPNKGWFNKFQRWLIRLCVVSESSKMYTHHLRSFGSIVKERRRQVLNYTFRIHPFSRAYFFWACIMVYATFMEMYFAALEYLLSSMNNTFVNSYWFIGISYQNDLIFWTNILFSFFIGYYDEPKQEVVFGLKPIARRYLQTFFLIDLLSALPRDVERYSRSIAPFGLFMTILNFLKFLLVIRFYNAFKYCAEIFEVNYYTYMRSLVLIFTLLYWHIVCCLLKFLREKVGTKRNNLFTSSKRSMIDIIRAEARRDYPVLHTIIGSFYRGSLIIYTASYGKVLPTTEGEIMLVWFGWYGSSMFFIYILAMVMEIMKGKTSAEYKYVEMERQLKDYMRHKQLPLQMRRRIMIYYEFRFQKRYFRETEILETISEQLRQEINMHACRKLVENVIFFRNLPVNLLVRIISCLRIEVYLVNDLIIKANTPGNSMYFISTGTVAIYTKSGKEICHLEDGSHFGEIALIIKGTLRTASVVAVEVSEIYRLDQKDFVKAISPYPDLLANIQHIAAERMEVASMLDDYNKMEQHASKK